MPNDELINWVVCGRLIGRATGWDYPDIFDLQIYNFEPATGYAGPVADCVLFRFENGTIETFDDDGEVKESKDLIESIQGCLVERTD